VPASEADIERLGRGMADFDRAQREPPTPVSVSEAEAQWEAEIERGNTHR